MTARPSVSPDDTSASPSEQIVIQTKKLTKRYGEKTAVDSLDLSIRRGEVFGLLGPNGAGKTTTILMLLGLTEPTAGTARVDGMIPTRDPLLVKSRVGYLPDEVGFYEDLTARQNLRYTAELNRLPRVPGEQRIDALLDDVGLGADADRKVGGYSRGMRQRLGLADALVKDPSILILDEPTVNIDPEGVRELLLLVERLRSDQGVTILLSSHLLHQVEQVCDRIGVFVNGKLVASGTIDELAGELDERWVFSVGTSGLSQPEQLLRATSGVVAVSRREGRWLLTATRDVRVDVQRRVFEAGGSLTHLAREGADLDAIYHRWFRTDGEAAAPPGPPIATAGRPVIAEATG
jgi:ABC-2 type transport system ATP-binding protein